MGIYYAMTKKEEKRRRVRVPVSCLNCKKRKVRCDKKKPCSGCVSNNVGHLCVYMEPRWADTLMLNGPDMEGYQKLREEMERVVRSQQAEIDRLKAELVNQLATSDSVRAEPVKTESSGPGLPSDKSEKPNSWKWGNAAGLALWSDLGQGPGNGLNGMPGLPQDQRHIQGQNQHQHPKVLDNSLPEGAAGPGSFGGPSVPSMDAVSVALNSATSTVSILRKLQDPDQARAPHVGADYTMIQFERPKKPASASNLYLWLNIIKLDPQLTALWYRITTMQKSYHIYKTMMLRQRDVPACGHVRCPVVACEFNMMVEESRAGSPERSEDEAREDYSLTEGDAESRHQRASEKGSRAEQNDSVYDGQDPNARYRQQRYSDAETGTGHSDRSGQAGCPHSQRGSRSHSVSSQSRPQTVKPEQNDVDAVRAEAVALLTRIQRLWHQIRTVSYPNLSYDQLMFLLDFYLRSGPGCPFRSAQNCHEVESQHLLKIFTSDMMCLFRRDGSHVVLDLNVYLPEISDRATLQHLRQKGVFLLMVALIVDEAMDVLTLHRALAPEVVAEYRKMFPATSAGLAPEVHVGRSRNGSQVGSPASSTPEGNTENHRNFGANMGGLAGNTGADNGGNIAGSLSNHSAHSSHLLGQVRGLLETCTINHILTVCLAVALLNRYVSVFKKVDGVRSDFSTVLMQLLELDIVLGADPSVVHVEASSLEGELRLLLCQVWADTVRLVNVVTVGIVPIARHLARMDQLLDRFLDSVLRAKAGGSHLRYLNQNTKAISPGSSMPTGTSDIPSVSSMHTVSSIPNGAETTSLSGRVTPMPGVPDMPTTMSRGISNVSSTIPGMAGLPAEMELLNSSMSGVSPMMMPGVSGGCPVGASSSSPGTSGPSGPHLDLYTSLGIHYVLSSASIHLRDGISGSVDSPVLISDLLRDARDAATSAAHISFTRLRMTRYFEARAAAIYVDLYLTYVVLLQSEDSGNGAAVASAIPALFSKCLDANKFLQSSVIQFSKGVDSQYVLEAVAETIARVAHLVAGLLIRFVAGNDPSVLVYLGKIGVEPPTISASIKDSVIHETDRTLQLLDNTMSYVHRASKVWRFYMTFIRSSHRMEPAYAKLQADAFGSGRFLDMCPVMPAAGKTPGNANTSENAKRCPMMSSSGKLITGAFPMLPQNGTMGKCPVVHSGGKCPVDHSAVKSQNHANTPSRSLGGTPGKGYQVDSPVPIKRQCPFPHESRTPVGSFHESNIRDDRLPKVKTEFESHLERDNRMGQRALFGPDLEMLTQMAMRNLVEGSRGLERGERNPVDNQEYRSDEAAPVWMPQVLLLATPVPFSSEMMDWDTLPNFNFDLGDDALGQLGADSPVPAIEGMFQ